MMITLLHTQSPDDGASLPVAVDTYGVGVSALRLFRGSSEGSDRALHADIVFDTSDAVSWGGAERLFEVYIYVLAEDHVATLTESMRITSWADLDKPWDDMSTASAGGTVARTVLVKTFLQQPDVH